MSITSPCNLSYVSDRYANRAKSIKNKPKINEDPKDALLREFQEEINRSVMVMSWMVGLEFQEEINRSEMVISLMVGLVSLAVEFPVLYACTLNLHDYVLLCLCLFYICTIVCFYVYVYLTVSCCCFVVVWFVFVYFILFLFC